MKNDEINGVLERKELLEAKRIWNYDDVLSCLIKLSFQDLKNDIINYEIRFKLALRLSCRVKKKTKKRNEEGMNDKIKNERRLRRGEWGRQNGWRDRSNYRWMFFGIPDVNEYSIKVKI